MRTGFEAVKTTSPIACTLTPGEYKDRLAWIADLTRDALLSHRRRDLALDLSFSPEAKGRVRGLVRREQGCCGFMTFDLREAPGEIQLTIRAPENARFAADALLEELIPRIAPRAADGVDENATPKPPAREKVARGVAVASATGAVACGVACVLPFALPAVVLAGTGSVLAWLEGALGWVTGVAAVSTGGAWAWIWRQSVGAGVRPARSTLCMMGLATVLLALAMAWPLIEPHIVRALSG